MALRNTVRSALGVIVALALPAVAGAQGSDAGVTDLTTARESAIRVDDIVEALAVPRGTRIEPTAPPTLRLPVYFEFGSAKLTSEAESLLEKVGQALRSGELDPFRFTIEGHTDDVGSEQYNAQLSEARAQTVKSFLVAQGVGRERLRAKGEGESRPVAPNQDEEGRKRNRRVEVINLGSEP